MIEIKKLIFQYPSGEFNLNINNFEVQASEKVAVIGPSGSGKTTVLNLISGIYTPNSGEVVVANQKISDSKDSVRRNFRIQNVGFIFQDFELLSYLNVLDNILHPYRITNALKLEKSVKERAKMLAAQMGISDKLNRKIDNLSQGEKQRVAICRALLPKPKLILADEATGNLDPENKSKILDLLFESVSKDKTTLLAVTHDHELLPRFDRVIDFNDFRMENSGA